MANNGKITLQEVKNALKDSRFRLTLPKEMEPDVNEFLNNPGCACHAKFYRRVLKDCREQLAKYFPGMEVPEHDEDIRRLAENHWTVINCSVNELESRLMKLGPGRKQLDVARWEDQVTVVVNELDMVF